MGCRATDLAGAENDDFHLQRLNILHHEPLRTLGLEVDLNARVSAVAFDVENNTFTELPVTHPAAESDTGDGRLFHAKAADGNRPRHLDPGTDFLDEIFGRFLDETRRRAVAVHAMQAALLGVGQEELFHGPRHADITEAAL